MIDKTIKITLFFSNMIVGVSKYRFNLGNEREVKTTLENKWSKELL